MMTDKYSKRAYLYLLAAAFFILVTGTVVYHVAEKFSWVNAYYFSVITLTTVGYGDLTPHTTFGKIFTTFYVLAGVGIITTFLTFTVRRRAEKISNRRNIKNQYKTT